MPGSSTVSITMAVMASTPHMSPSTMVMTLVASEYFHCTPRRSSANASAAVVKLATTPENVQSLVRAAVIVANATTAEKWGVHHFISD